MTAGPPGLSRTGWLALIALVGLGSGLGLRWVWPSTLPALDCPAEEVRFDGGLAFCAAGSPRGTIPVGPGLTVGVKLDLNRATAEELAVLPGIGPSLAKKIAEERTAQGGAFSSWDQVDQVPGIGAAKLEVLQSSAEIR
jgi:competence protein ComEA